MRAGTAAFAMVGPIALGAAATTEAFLVAPSMPLAAHTVGRPSSALRAGQADGAAAASLPSAGVLCICGLAAVVAASPKGRRSTAKARGAVAVKVGKAANLIAQRLQEAAQVSEKFQKALSGLKATNARMVQELEATEAKAKALEAERDGLKTQLHGLVDQIDNALMGRLQSSAAMATNLTAMKAVATPQVNVTEKVQSLEAERDALKAQLNALVGQIDDALLAPLKTSAAMAEQLSSLKEAAQTSASVAASATTTASTSSRSYPAPAAKKGSKRGKTFFPLPYPDFSIGQCYSY